MQYGHEKWALPLRNKVIQIIAYCHPNRSCCLAQYMEKSGDRAWENYNLLQYLNCKLGLLYQIRHTGMAIPPWCSIFPPWFSIKTIDGDPTTKNLHSHPKPFTNRLGEGVYNQHLKWGISARTLVATRWHGNHGTKNNQYSIPTSWLGRDKLHPFSDSPKYWHQYHWPPRLAERSITTSEIPTTEPEL